MQTMKRTAAAKSSLTDSFISCLHFLSSPRQILLQCFRASSTVISGLPVSILTALCISTVQVNKLCLLSK